jgi:hypothetical protein
MKEGLAALTKFVKVVMSYRPDRENAPKPVHKQRVASSPKRGAKRPTKTR